MAIGSGVKNPFMRVMAGETVSPPPVWIMRQAGRYLPEYLETRKKAGSFLDLCFNPDRAVEVTLQPIRRFGFDASILFSDILVVPQALSRNLDFVEGTGPVMTPIRADEITGIDGAGFHDHLAPVYETVRRLRAELSDNTALIGFCGAPWTVATYMIAGRGTPDQAPARLFALEHPAAFDRLLMLLADHSAQYLSRQIDAGADVVQIFDSWAGVLDEGLFERCAILPVKRIVDQLRGKHGNVPIIGFPKGSGSRFDNYRQKTGVDVLGLDWTVPLDQAARLQADGPVQGNLDPMRLVAGGEALVTGVRAILDRLGNGPLVFNLGHGVVPETPVSHVEELIRLVRAGDHGR